MSENRSKYEFMQSASLSQKLAFKDKIYQVLAGSDPETSMQIAFLQILGDEGLIDLQSPEMTLRMKMLNAKRKALFATSEKVNEITKMGLQMPKAEEEIDLGGLQTSETDT